MEHLQDQDVFDFQSLPLEILIEIFSKLSQQDRLPLAFVCQTWLKAVRSARFNYPFRVLQEETKLNSFIEIFGSNHSKFLPIDCIEIHMDRSSRNWDLFKIREIFATHSQVKLHLHTNVKPCHFKFLYDSLPMVKNIHWELYNKPCASDAEFCAHDFQTHWTEIRSIPKSTKILIDLICCLYGCCQESIFQEEALNIMSIAPKENFCVDTVMMDLSKFKNLADLAGIMKTVKSMWCHANTIEHLEFINSFGKQNLSRLEFHVSHVKDMMEYLPDLNNLQRIRFATKDCLASEVRFTQTVLNFPELKKITIAISSTGFDRESFAKLLKSCPKLDNVKLTADLEELAIDRMDRMVDLAKVVSNCCPLLKKFSLVLEDWIHQPANSVMHLLIEQHIKNFRCLESFKTHLVFDDLVVLSNLHWNSLTKLEIIFSDITLLGAAALVNAFPNLKTLILSAYRPTLMINEECTKLFSHFKQLKTIKCVGCKFNVDTHLDHLEIINQIE